MSLSLTVTGGGGWEEEERGKDRGGWGGEREEQRRKGPHMALIYKGQISLQDQHLCRTPFS